MFCAPCPLGHTPCIDLYAKELALFSVSFSFFIFISRAKAFMLDTQVCLLLGKMLIEYLLLKVALEIFCIF